MNMTSFNLFQYVKTVYFKRAVPIRACREKMGTVPEFTKFEMEWKVRKLFVIPVYCKFLISSHRRNAGLELFDTFICNASVSCQESHEFIFESVEIVVAGFVCSKYWRKSIKFLRAGDRGNGKCCMSRSVSEDPNVWDIASRGDCRA